MQRSNLSICSERHTLKQPEHGAEMTYGDEAVTNEGHIQRQPRPGAVINYGRR